MKSHTIRLLITIVSFSLGLCTRVVLCQSASHYIGTNERKARVLVFVHGIHGDRKTWLASNNAYWPQLVSTDPRFAKSDVFVADYPTPTRGNTKSIDDLAIFLWKELSAEQVWTTHREVVFVCHSLGGSVVERMLLLNRQAADQVPFIVFYGTPHAGAFIAQLAAVFNGDPILRELIPGDETSYLARVDTTWRAGHLSGLHRFCAFEGEDTGVQGGWRRYFGAHIRVVRYYSATYGCDSSTPVAEILSDHIGMVKPPDRRQTRMIF